MSPSERVNRHTREEWRGLGFYYEHRDGRWVFVGAPSGLRAFPRLLRAYAGGPRNAVPGEHEHYGPYMYLKVVTGDEPRICEDAIRGSLPDLARLADLFEQRLRVHGPGSSFEIGHDYGPRNTSGIRVEVRPEGFDPAAADPLL
jgi:hypothetical protein